MMNGIKRKFRLFYLGFPLGIIIISLLAFRSVDFRTSKSLDVFFSFFRELSIFYVDKTDPEKLIYVGIEAILESLDPYSEFISEENIDALEFQTTGEYGGMGALIRHSPDFPVIAEVYEGSPAHKAGLMAGDVIVQVNEKSVRNTSVDKVSKMLKGVPNSNLKVVVMRYNQPDSLVFEFKRERIHIPSVPYYGMVSDEIGYIRLANFTNNCDKEVERALKNVISKKKAKGLILDLRGNPGGLLFEAVKIVNLFVEKDQLVVYTKGQIKEFDQEYKTPSKPIDTEIPLAILVDRISASASEIVAGSLQDMDRAIIIGERTFGKGLVQATRPLPYNNQMKVTTAKYYIPSGRCIQAIDFAQRNEDGSINFIPDSLIVEFKTQNGRIVLDGGGITPDVEHKASMYSRISSILYAQNHLFEYATRFRSANPNIDDPSDFILSDSQFEDFIAYLEAKGFRYQSQTEYALNELINIAKQENYYDKASEIIDHLSTLIKGNMVQDLNLYSSEIKRLLGEEIVGRYYYQQGKAMHNISFDEVIPIGIGLLTERERYNSILSVYNIKPEQRVSAHTQKMLKLNNNEKEIAKGYGKQSKGFPS